MGRPRALTDEQVASAVKMHDSMGYTYASVAERLGVPEATVSSSCRRYHREMARREEQELQRDMVVAGNKQDGQLRAVAPNQYDGSRRLPNGRFARRRFVGSEREAEEQWREWCDGIDDRERFERMVRREAGVERPETEPEQGPADGPEADAPAGAEPVTAEEGQSGDGEEGPVDNIQPEGSQTSYVLYFSRGCKPISLFHSLARALRMADVLTMAAKASGMEGEYLVEEISYELDE
jgi:transposase-like protein